VTLSISCLAVHQFKPWTSCHGQRGLSDSDVLRRLSAATVSKLRGVAEAMDEFVARVREDEYKKQKEPVTDNLAQVVVARLNALTRGDLLPAEAAVLADELRRLAPMLAYEPATARTYRQSVRSYERMLSSLPLASRDKLWPATEFNLRLFVMMFVLRDRNLARTARSYVSGIVSVSRTTFPRGTILPERLTVINRWIKKLERFDTYDIRHAEPLTRDVLFALWQGLDLSQTPLLQLFVMCLISFQAALRSDNAAHGIKLKHIHLLEAKGAISIEMPTIALEVHRAKRGGAKTAQFVPIVPQDTLMSGAHWLALYVEAQFGVPLPVAVVLFPDAPLFPKTQRLDGTWTQWSQADHNSRIRAAARACGIAGWKRLSGHSGRHGFVSHAVAMGMPLDAIQMFTGHRSIDSLRPYLHRSWLSLLRWSRMLQE